MDLRITNNAVASFGFQTFQGDDHRGQGTNNLVEVVCFLFATLKAVMGQAVPGVSEPQESS